MTNPVNAGGCNASEADATRRFDPDTENLLREFGVDIPKFTAMMDFIDHTQCEKAAAWAEFAAGALGADDELEEQLRWDDRLELLIQEFDLDPEAVRGFFHAFAERRRKQDLRLEQMNSPYRYGENLTFDTISEWPDEVTAAAILPELVELIRRCAGLTEPLALIVALWVLHTHALPAFECTPRLVIASAERGGAKPRLMRLLSHVVPRPLPICAGSPRALLDSLGYSPTLLIQDGGTLLRGGEIAAMLRNGWQRNNYLALNLQREIQTLDLFTAAAVAVETRSPPALKDRCIEIRTDSAPAETEALRLPEHIVQRLDEMRRMASRWAADAIDRLRDAGEPRRPDDENWAPLLTIAADAGAEWEARAREAMHTLRGATPAPLQLLLRDISTLVGKIAAGEIVLPGPDGAPLSDRDRVRSCDLARLLAGLDAGPWREWGTNGQPITTNALARLLAEAGIRPASLHFRAVDQAGAASYFADRGYLVSRFTEAFARHLA